MLSVLALVYAAWRDRVQARREVEAALALFAHTEGLAMTTARPPFAPGPRERFDNAEAVDLPIVVGPSQHPRFEHQLAANIYTIVSGGQQSAACTVYDPAVLEALATAATHAAQIMRSSTRFATSAAQETSAAAAARADSELRSAIVEALVDLETTPLDTHGAPARAAAHRIAAAATRWTAGTFDAPGFVEQVTSGLADWRETGLAKSVEDYEDMGAEIHAAITANTTPPDQS